MLLDLLARYWAKVDRRTPEECWPWTGSRTEKGYGQLGNGKKIRNRSQRSLATHIALAIDGRPRPSSKHLAMHSCDNPICVNPGHLSWGTHAENMADMIAKGRSAAQAAASIAMAAAAIDLGRRHNAKLTKEQAIYIRASNKTIIALAEELGVTNQCISNVRTGRTWRNA